MNLHGIPKPAYRAYELLHRLGTEQLHVDGIHEPVNAWVVRQEHSVTALLTNHALPRHGIETQQVRVSIGEAPEPRAAYVERIDETHANPRGQWREMGAPDYLSALQVEQLQMASRVAREPHPWKYEDRVVQIEIELPPHAVAAITVEFD